MFLNVNTQNVYPKKYPILFAVYNKKGNGRILVEIFPLW